jgi:hypothetical protein
VGCGEKKGKKEKALRTGEPIGENKKAGREGRG